MSPSRSRLHISPLNPDLLDAILGPRLSAYANTVSYHHIQTAPENDFGYIELPTMDAENVKKKLNGAILKGKKLKVEDARPTKRTFAGTEDDVSEPQTSISRRSKRSKVDLQVLQAHELSPDRKVKRGWTESKAEKSNKNKIRDKSKKKSKSQAPSKYSEHPELLFRTKVPANKASDETREKRKKSKKASDTDVIHEFEKTGTVLSFLRNDVNPAPDRAVEYKDGEGWVDENGKVIEQESSKISKKRKAAKMSLEIDTTKAQALHNQRPKQNMPSPPPSQSTTLTRDSPDDETSSSGTSSSSESSSESEADSESESVDDTADTTTPQHATKAIPAPVHPLEAIFKKPRIPTGDKAALTSNSLSSGASPSSAKSKPSLELATTFAFFPPSSDEEEEDEEKEEKGVTVQQSPHTNNISNLLPPMPMTPFSSQDFRVRRIRSAAPTPDTADIRKSSGYGSLILGEDDPDDVLSEPEDDSNNAATGNGADASNSQGLPQSEFERRFWEKRGENNRAWKARRRAVLKEQRQRDNRARRPRNY